MNLDDEILSGSKLVRGVRGLFRRALSGAGALAVTVLLFLVLPIINQIAEGAQTDTIITKVDTIDVDTDDEPLEEPEEDEPEEEEPEEEEPPELEEEIEPIDLSALEDVLSNAGGIGGAGAGQFGLPNLAKEMLGNMDEVFDMGALGGGRPVPVSQNPPNLSGAEKRATPGRATVAFVVNAQGRVETPIVKSATSKILGDAAIRTVKSWRFQPVKKDGKAVRVAVSQIIEFPDQK